MALTFLDAGSPLASMDMTALVEAGRGYTKAQNLAAVDRIDAVFAMLCATERRLAEQEAAEHEATEQEAAEQERAAGAKRRRPRPEYARLSPDRLVRAHVITAMGATSYSAGRLVEAAIQLHTRLFRLSRAAREGVLDEALIVDLACRLRDVPDRLIHDVENIVVSSVATRAHDGNTPSRHGLGELIDRALESLDPDETDRQHENARQERRVTFRPRGQGMTSMWANLTTEDAEALHARLSAAADDRPADDPRTTAQRLADALAALADTDPSGAGTSPDGDAAPARPARAGRLNITVIAASAQGLPTRVEFVRGAYSSFDWLCAQVLAEETTGARFEIVDPVPGAEDDPDQALKYFLSEKLKRRIRMRDRTCRHPGCRVPAERCEVDHVIAFNHADPARGGPSAEWNLVCLCKGHHQEKTFGPWTYRPGPDGELIISTETGHEYRTYPDGILAQARDDHDLANTDRWFRRYNAAAPPGRDATAP